MAEAFTNNRDIIMVNNHPEAIAGSILRLRANKEERIRIGNNAGDNVRASFDAVSIARQFLVAAEKCIR
jgi:16S rRNA G1207 methylase RsmC